ncbi:MAG TPA: apolipoprotein N-acyltransferase [Longimicrobiales bacterium]|nr:apolipoprotein N-acyltransferase [Longimicrobiales bacterium]
MTLPSRGDSLQAVRAGTVLSGCLLFLAFLPLPGPGAVQVALPFVALVPWLVVTEGLDPRAAARAGALLGAVFWSLHLGWMLSLAGRIAEVWPALAWTGEVALLSLLWAGMGASRAVLLGRNLPPVVAAAVAWVAIEWARGTLLGPLRFPWTPLALPLARVPVLLQPGAWGGEALLSFGVVVGNVLVASAVGRRDESGRKRPLLRAGGAVLLLLGGWTGAGAVRESLVGDGAEVRARVTVVQPDVSLAERRSRGAAEAALASLRRGLTRAAAEEAALVVFPETHLPYVVGGEGRPAEGIAARGLAPAPDGLVAELARWSAARGADVLVGGYLRDETGVVNGLLRVDGSGLAGAYGKEALVPGVERSPGDGLVPGRGPGVLEAEGRPGVLICIESAWSSLSRRRALAGAGWLLNVTNDAWLAEAPSGPGWAAFLQHPWHLALRSVETGLGAVRVGNDGWSGTTDPLGRWTPALEPHAPGVATVTVRSLPGPTLFLRSGGLLGPLCGLLAIGASILRRTASPA